MRARPGKVVMDEGKERRAKGRDGGLVTASCFFLFSLHLYFARIENAQEAERSEPPPRLSLPRVSFIYLFFPSSIFDLLIYMCFSSLEFLLFIATAEAARGAEQQLRLTRPINAALGWTRFKAKGQRF